MLQRRKWQPTPVFLPGESQGRGSLVGFHLRGRTESDKTEAKLGCLVGCYSECIFDLIFQLMMGSSVIEKALYVQNFILK